MLFLFLMVLNIAGVVYFGIHLPYHWAVSTLLSILFCHLNFYLRNCDVSVTVAGQN